MNPSDFLAFLCLLLFNSMLIAGLFIASRYELKKNIPTFSVKPKLKDIDEDSKMILWKLSFYSEKWFGHFYAKPVINCMVCMASVHSTYFYWYFQELTIHNLILYLFYVPSLAFFNSQLAKIC